ncbi:unnamed protein product, partial [Iphiclides podalirius]
MAQANKTITMKTLVVLFAVLLAMFTFLEKTSARPNLNKFSLSIDEDRNAESGFGARDREYVGRERRTRHSRQIPFGDVNQIWGDNVDEVTNGGGDDDDDGSRPISLKPVNANRPQGLPAPPVEHGSVQAEKTSTSTPAPTTQSSDQPSICEAAVISCCRFGESDRERCFEKYNCSRTYSTGMACSPRVIQMVIEHFKRAYAPR